MVEFWGGVAGRVGLEAGGGDGQQLPPGLQGGSFSVSVQCPVVNVPLSEHSLKYQQQILKVDKVILQERPELGLRGRWRPRRCVREHCRPRLLHL